MLKIGSCSHWSRHASLAVANAQETLVYSFEPDLQGFVGNGPLTPSLETSGLGATHGSNSMKAVHAQFNGFAGASRTNIPAGFPNDPSDPGIDFLRFDLTLTSRFAPRPVPGQAFPRLPLGPHFLWDVAR